MEEITKTRGKVKRKCLLCGKEFFIFKAWTRDGKAGKYCSMSCASKAKPHKNSKVVLVCKECGKEYTVRRYRKDSSNYCSKKCQGKARSRLYVGEKHPLWRGGNSRSNNKLRIWRNSVLRNCNYKCVKCGDTDINKLHAHHILNYSDFPEYRYDVRNGIALCIRCHAIEHSKDKLYNFILKGVERSGVYKRCKICGNEYYVVPSKINTSKYCSRKCLHKSLRRPTILKCQTCNKLFEVPTNEASRGRKYCCRKCYNNRKRRR